MKIEFELIDNKTIKIIGIENEVRKEIGQIFTPSGTLNENPEAIQICGFTKIAQLWGCGVYGKVDIKNKLMDNTLIHFKNVIHNKDIQLQFDYNTEKLRNSEWDMLRDCDLCFNKPCTCKSFAEDIKGIQDKLNKKVAENI